MLATEAHGGLGGIAQYNQDVLEALSNWHRIQEVVVLPRISGDAFFTSPAGITYDTRSSRGRISFVAASLRHVIAGDRFDLVYAAHINLMPVAARIAQLSRIPLLLAIYGIDAWTRPAGQAAKLAAKQTDHVLSISDVTLRRFQEWSGFPGEKTSVCPNGIHLEQYGIGQKSEALLRRHNLTGRKVIMTFGRLAPEERYKGFDEVLETLPALIEQEPDLCYMIAGDGGDRGRLEAKARNLGVASNVVFTGRISNKEKADYYRLADAFVMPSHGEGFGFVILEALACGIPVIASTGDGTREAVRNGELGFVVDPDDSEGLKAAIFEALARPRRIPPGLEYFAFPNFAERLCCVFDNVIMNRQGSR